MRRPISFLLFFVFLGVIPISFTNCITCNCDDPGPNKYFIADSLELALYTQYQIGFDSTLYYPYDSIELAICTASLHQISQLKRPPHFQVSFTSTVNACSCKEPGFFVQNHISSIQIISKIDSTYNDNILFENGKLINDYVKVRLNYMQDKSYSINDFLNTFKMPEYNNLCIYLKLAHKPSKPITLVFDMEIKLNDGKVFLFQNKELKVK